MTIFNSFLTPPFYDSSSMEVSFFIFSWWADKDCQITNNRNDNKVFILSRVHLLNCLVTAPVSFPGVAMVILRIYQIAIYYDSRDYFKTKEQVT